MTKSGVLMSNPQVPEEHEVKGHYDAEGWAFFVALSSTENV